MSFGFSIGDFLAVYELVNKIYKDFAGAPEQFQQISKELKCLENAIRPIEVLSSEEDLSSAQQKSLADILKNCNDVLRDTQKTVNKYRESLGLERPGTGEKATRGRSRLRWVPDRIRRRTPKNYSSLEPGGVEVGEGVKRLWKRVQFEPEDIRDLRARITLSIGYVGAFRDELRKDQEQKPKIQKQKQEILAWLTPIDYSAHQSDFIRRRQAGTGQWLLDSPEYRHWVATKKEALFCPGIPGAGKTMLASIVVDSLLELQRADKSIAVCYIFLNFRQSNEQKLDDLMAGILKQLAQAQLGLSEGVESLYNNHKNKGSGSRPTVSELRQAIQSGVRELSRVFIVIDALDECQTDDCQYKFISELLYLWSDLEANVLATSRFIPAITSRFDSAVRREIRASDEDIIRYVDGNLSRLPGFVSRDSTLQTEIKESIVKSVDGMFLLAQLHLDSIRDTTSRKGVRVALSKLGKGSDAYDIAYNDAMARIKGQLPRHEDLALRTLLWITYAKRPLTTLELRHALGVEPETTEFDEDNLPDLEDMVSNCCGLVTVDEERGIIRLVHYTTQEYFERTGASWFPDAQFQILRACITYLSFDVFENGACVYWRELTQRLSTYPLYEYASDHWGHHAYSDSDYQRYCVVFLTQISKTEACSQVLFGRRWPIGRLKGTTGLHLAAFFGLYEAARNILATEDPNPLDSDGMTPMKFAITEGHLSVVELLLERGVTADSMVSGRPLLWYAAFSGHEAIVRLLLNKGASANSQAQIRDMRGDTALSIAVWRGHEAVVRLLLEKGAPIDPQPGVYGTSPLHKAVEGNQESIVRLLLENGAKVDSKEVGETPLVLAAARGVNIEIIRLLLENGADINSKNNNGNSPLLYAARRGSADKVKLFLEHGADINSKNNNGDSPLLYAARCSSADKVKLFLENSTDINPKNNIADSPLLYNVDRGSADVVKLLLEHGADINSKNNNGDSPLLYAARCGSADKVKLFLENNADVNSKNNIEDSPLLYAASCGNADVVKLLLEHGADINSKNNIGNSPLLYAANCGSADVVKLLLEHGADINCKDHFGYSPLWYALRRRNRTDVVQLLREYGARS